MRVYTGGTFDLLHYGHGNLLRQCRHVAGPNGSVTVGLNLDDFVATYKGRPPVLTYRERAAALIQCRYVDHVVPNIGGPDSRPAILQANPDVIVVGSDWQYKDYEGQIGVTREWLDEYGIEIRYVRYTEGISSSDIRRRLCP